MLSEHEFQDHMSSIEKYLNQVNLLEKAIESICMAGQPVLDLADDMLQNYINLLADYMDDEEDAIGWFVYDNMFGKNKEKYYSSICKGSIVNNVNQLYKVLVRNSKK